MGSLLLPIAMGCSLSPPPPNVLLVVIDTLRADHTSVYGYARRTTPSLEALAERGILFETAYSSSSSTAPSVASLLTSQHPTEHAVLKNGQPLAEGYTTLAEQFREAGFQTAGFVSSYVLDPSFGFGQGFDVYDAAFTREGETHPVDDWAGTEVPTPFDRRADETTRRALAWLGSKRDPNRPFLLLVHYFDPHTPYQPPPEFADRFTDSAGSNPATGELLAEIRRYDAEIAFTDQQLGKLLAGFEAASEDSRTLVAVVGDHGEGLGDHGAMRHGVHIYEPFVRVPWILRLPDERAAGSTIAGPVSLVDVLPTLTELAGIAERPSSTAGRSIAAHILQRSPLAATPILFQRRHYEPGTVEGIRVAGVKYGVRLDHWKYLEAPSEGTVELYDLGSDPGEVRNQATTQRGVAAELRRFLLPQLEGGREPDAIPLSEQARQALEGLGYVE